VIGNWQEASLSHERLWQGPCRENEYVTNTVSAESANWLADAASRLTSQDSLYRSDEGGPKLSLSLVLRWSPSRSKVLFSSALPIID
jgi:hypothetical protein